MLDIYQKQRKFNLVRNPLALEYLKRRKRIKKNKAQAKNQMHNAAINEKCP